MLFGVALVLTWLILLLRYPAKALPVSMAAVAGLGLIATWVLWQESRDERDLAHLELRLRYDPQQCPADRPLAVSLSNGSSAALQELRWEVAAYLPGQSVNLAQRLYQSPRYSGPGELLPGASWHECMPLPDLRSGYRPATLEFRAERLQGRFVR